MTYDPAREAEAILKREATLQEEVKVRTVKANKETIQREVDVVTLTMDASDAEELKRVLWNLGEELHRGLPYSLARLSEALGEAL